MSNTNPFTSSEIKEVSIITPELNKHEIVGLSAKAIEQAFAPMVARLQEIESEFYTITQKPINDETIAEAKELRQRMVKIRTSTAAVHKEQKAESLRKGKAIDGIKNILEAAIVDKEIALSKIEKHFINIEAEAKQKIWNERYALISPFIGDVANTIPLADLNQEVFDNMVHGYRLAAEEKARLERQAELDRKEAEEKKALEDKRIRAENEQLKLLRTRIMMLTGMGSIEMSEIVELHDNKTGYNTFATIEHLKTWSDEEFKKCLAVFNQTAMNNNEVYVKEQQKLERQKTATENKLKEEREQRKRLEKEQQEREEKEQQERKQKAADERRLKRAPSKVKLLDFAESIKELKCETLNDNDAQQILLKANRMISEAYNFIILNANNL